MLPALPDGLAAWQAPGMLVLLVPLGAAAMRGRGARESAAACTLLAPPYDFNALEPPLGEQTMRIHQGKHHQTYITNLNAALEGQSAPRGLSIDAPIGDLTKGPANIRTAVRSNDGGYRKQAPFRGFMTPGGAEEPRGTVGCLPPLGQEVT